MPRVRTRVGEFLFSPHASICFWVSSLSPVHYISATQHQAHKSNSTLFGSVKRQTSRKRTRKHTKRRISRPQIKFHYYQSVLRILESRVVVVKHYEITKLEVYPVLRGIMTTSPDRPRSRGVGRLRSALARCRSSGEACEDAGGRA